VGRGNTLGFNPLPHSELLIVERADEKIKRCNYLFSMKLMSKIGLIVLPLLVLSVLFADRNSANTEKRSEDNHPTILFYQINLKKSSLDFYLKDEHGNNFKNFKMLKDWLSKQDKKLRFAMNGGMYNPDFSPQGLYIEKGKVIQKLDTLKTGYGNFYLQPNGVFYITNSNEARIETTETFGSSPDIKYATQSGPMLLINGEIHPKFTQGSKNVHIRNGVGLLPNGELLFAMSKKKINFYDFAKFFQEHNCKQALYLDGFVSRTYLPAKNWIQEDGEFEQ
jgi:uncharacterized protein YigE (DUF2233 family)